MDVVLPIPPVRFIDGNYDTGASIDRCCAPDTASGTDVLRDHLLGPVLIDVVLPIPPVTLDHIV